MSIGKINASLAGGLTQETTLALANLNFDFSLCKVDAPMEYQGLGECLSKRRRAAAESGNEHRMARKLGALFSHTLPATPNLVRAYGKRATEIIRESSKRESSSKRNDGVFGEWTGPDATSIWAAATSGAGAIAAHLLACMLARMWTASEAAAVWEEIIESRKLEIANSDPGTPLWQSQELAAKVETTREQISMWDSSARSWLEIADRSRMKQQKQLKLLVDDAGIPVNQASTTYRSVMDAWTTALSTVEKLLEGVSQSINNGAVILALTSWHIFPDMFVVGAGPNIIHQNDSLYPKGTVITLGQSSRTPSASSDGVFWSLPLAFLKYYGDPVVRTRTLGESTSRLTFSEFMQVVLGSVLAGWGDYALDVEKACINIVSVADFLSTNRHQEPNRPRAWIHLLGESAESFLAEAGSPQPLLRGLTMRGLRRYKHLLWEADEEHPPLFGLASSNTVIELIDDMEDKISFLRLVAPHLKNANHCNTIIRYRVRKHDSVKPYSQQSIFGLSRPHQDSESDEDDDFVWPSEWSWEYATAIEEVQNQKARKRKYTDLSGHIRWTDREAFTADSGEAYIQAMNPATHKIDSQSRSFYWDDSGTTSPKFLPGTEWVCVVGNPDVAAIFTTSHKSSIGTVTPLAHFQGSQSGAVGPAAPAACLNCSSRTLKCDGHTPCTCCVASQSECVYIASRRGHVERSSGFEVLRHEDIDEALRRGWINRDQLVKLMDLRREFTSLRPSKYLHCLRAFAAAAEAYKLMPGATISTEFFSVPFNDVLWIPRNQQRSNVRISQSTGTGLNPLIYGSTVDPRLLSKKSRQENRGNPVLDDERYLMSYTLSRNQIFSCIAMFENRKVNVDPGLLNQVMAISAGGSIYVAVPLICDPFDQVQPNEIKHITGNISKPGLSLMIPPMAPNVRKVDEDKWTLINHAPFDGQLDDCFQRTSLHLSFTGYQLPLMADEHGYQGVEANFVETLVSVFDAHEWVADLDVLKALAMPSVSRIGRHAEGCCHEKASRKPDFHLTSIDSWSEFIDRPSNACIFRASGNWLARLSAVAVNAQQNLETIVLEDGKRVCWECIQDTAKIQEKDLQKRLLFIG